MTGVLLPRVPSRLIRLACDDLEWARSQPDRYVIDMRQWMVPINPKKCSVCMAGAVMAHTLQMQSYFGIYGYPVRPTQAGQANASALFAINRFRMGSFAYGARALDPMITFEKVTELREIEQRFFPGWIRYKDDPEGFLQQMRRLADELEKINL